MKRKDYISWDELFMGIAQLASKRSKDPRTQIGACIVNNKNRVISLGYNGMPNGCSDDEFPWDNEQKYDYVVHAEINAILNAATDLEDCIMYLYTERGYLPCSKGCAQAIIQKGIKEVVLKSISNDVSLEKKYEATRKMFDAVGIKIRVLENS